MAEVDTSFYPKPPQQQDNNPLSQIIRLGQAQDSLGQLEVGRGMQQALQPDGSVDQNVLAGILQQSRAGASKAIPTMHALQQLKSAGFAADQAGLDTFQKRMAITHHLFSGLASIDNPTIKDVYDIAARALDPALDAKKYGLTLPVIMNAIKAFRGPNGEPLSPAEIKKKALQIQTQAASTSEILGQHSPRFQVIDRGGNVEVVPMGTGENPALGTTVTKNLGPGTVVRGPEGDQYLGEQPNPGPSAQTPGGRPAVPIPQPRPAAAGMGELPMPGQPGSSAPIVPTPIPTVTPQGTAPGITPRGPAASRPPGFDEASAGVAQASAQGANALTAASDGAPTRAAQLLNLRNFMSDFTTGTGADWERKFKNFAIRNVPLPAGWKEQGAYFNPKSLASQEEFTKTATQLMQQQFSTIGGTGTDAKFSSAAEANPNELLSQLGNKGIITMLLGNEDAIKAKNTAWQRWLASGKGPQTYGQFALAFNDKYDPRVFMLNRMSPAERQEYFDRIDPDDIEPLVEKIKQAKMKPAEGGFGLSFDTPAPRGGTKK